VSGKLALTGRVVTMDAQSAVLPRGTVYVDGSTIVAVQDASVAPPQDFAGVQPIELGVTIHPGLIELHNHLTYDALSLWSVPDRYGNRGVWQRDPRYQQRVSRPMGVIGKAKTLIPAVVRYVETKCLMGGVTTSQGIGLVSDSASKAYYRGTVRVVESPHDPTLPAAATRIPDVGASDRDTFLAELQKYKCVLLHLAEGLDAPARKHFTDLRYPGSTKWAIAGSLAGIHCAALNAADFAVMAAHGASMVWSPLSNLLLYGGTADVAAAASAGVRIALGSDWAPSGSKNLLGELKAAHAWVQMKGLPFKERDLLAMVTRDAAAILHWDKAVGSIAPTLQADLLLVDGTAGDPYAALFHAPETAVAAVIIGGTPHYGHLAAMRALGVAGGEAVSVGGTKQLLAFDPATEYPGMDKVSFAFAESTLRDALGRPPDYTPSVMPKLAAGSTPMELRVGAGSAPGSGWMLELDELGGTGETVRPLIGEGARLAPPLLDLAAAPPLPPVPLQLSAPTVADDAQWFTALGAEQNLPGGLVAALQALY
jgi:cytosine/adenosine deaminase-related metal-dependent hydrolase